MKLVGLVARQIRDSFTIFIGKPQPILFIRRRKGANGGLLWTRQWTLGFCKRWEFFDKLSELSFQERTRCLVIAPSDADHFLPRLSQFITYSPQTTKQLVRHSVSNFTLLTRISSTSRSRESTISKKKIITLFRPIITTAAWRVGGEGQRDLGLSKVAESKGQPNEHFISKQTIFSVKYILNYRDK